MEKSREYKVKKVHHRRKVHWDDRLFGMINGILLVLSFICFLYPIWFVAIASVSDPGAVLNGEVILLPKGFSLEGYKKVFSYADIWLGYTNSIIYAAVGSLLRIVVTAMAGYVVSRRDYRGRTFIMVMFLVTNYISGGMIPGYLNVKSFGLLDTRLWMWMNGLISVHYMIICRTYFSNSVPYELQEAAFIDGASDFYVFRKIVMPLSKPIVVVMLINFVVGYWNNFFDAMVYLKTKALFPLQLFLRDILLKGRIAADMLVDLDDPEAVLSVLAEVEAANQIKYAVIMVAVLPLLLAYPWLEKYFEKGIMIGGIKG